VFVLQSVYHCSDRPLGLTNRLRLPWKRPLGAATIQISDILSLTTLLRRSALYAQVIGESLRQRGHAFRLNLPFGVDLLEESALQQWRAEDGLHSARAAAALHCLAAPSADVESMQKERRTAESRR
jgi:hypothetical protein